MLSNCLGLFHKTQNVYNCIYLYINEKGTLSATRSSKRNNCRGNGPYEVYIYLRVNFLSIQHITLAYT